MINAIRDLYRLFVPISDVKERYGFAFLVHPRNRFDVTRKYPIVRFLPKKILDLFTGFLWPIVLSEIGGLRDLETKEEIKGWVISVPLTAQQMTENRALALKRIIQAGRLAQNMGAKIVGLGALTSSFSRGGLDLVEQLELGVTTGHAYTAFTIVSYINSVQVLLKVKKEFIKIAIVGASGSIGSTCAQVLARGGYRDFILIDLERKFDKLTELENQLRELNPFANIIISSDVNKCQETIFVLTATNTPETIIKNEHILSGTIIFDDAQPSDISKEVLERSDVLVLEAGVVSTPSIQNNFNFGLKTEIDNFSCLGEVIILAFKKWRGHYVINRATLKDVDDIGQMGKRLNIDIAKFQNRKEMIPDEKIKKIKELVLERINVN